MQLYSWAINTIHTFSMKWMRFKLRTSGYTFNPVELNRPIRHTRRYRKHRVRYAAPTDLPSAFYRIDQINSEKTLVVKRMSGVVSILLLSDPVSYPGLRRRTSFALRSAVSNSRSSGFTLVTKKSTIGPEQGLYFLGSNETIKDAKLGESFQISIPETAIFGYWEKRIFQKKMTAGTSCRLLIIGDGVKRCYKIKL